MSVCHPPPTTNKLTDLHPATQTDLRRNTPSLLPCCKRKQIIIFSLLSATKKPRNIYRLVYKIRFSYFPRPRSWPSRSELLQQRIVAACLVSHCLGLSRRPLAGSTVCRRKKGVGRIRAYVCLLGGPMPEVTAGQSAEISARGTARCAQEDDVGEGLPEQQQQHPLCLFPVCLSAAQAHLPCWFCSCV